MARELTRTARTDDDRGGRLRTGVSRRRHHVGAGERRRTTVAGVDPCPSMMTRDDGNRKGKEGGEPDVVFSTQYVYPRMGIQWRWTKGQPV